MALVSHCVVVGVDADSVPDPATPEEAAGIPHEHLSADVLHAFPLTAISTPTGAVPPLPDSVALFCLPAGVIPKKEEDQSADKISFFSFVLTNIDGSRSFGTCVSWYEPLEKYPGEARATFLLAFARHSRVIACRNTGTQGSLPHVIRSILHTLPLCSCVSCFAQQDATHPFSACSLPVAYASDPQSSNTLTDFSCGGMAVGSIRLMSS